MRSTSLLLLLAFAFDGGVHAYHLFPASYSLPTTLEPTSTRISSINKRSTTLKASTKTTLASSKEQKRKVTTTSGNEEDPSSRFSLGSITETDWFWKGSVVLLAFLWATNFPFIKMMYDAAPELDPALYSAMRFSLGGLVFVPFMFSLPKVEKEARDEIIFWSVLTGAVLFFGYFGQAKGLIESTAGKGAFICTLQVVLVALYKGWESKSFQTATWLAVGLAVFGTGLLELQGSQPPVTGDLWLLLQPLGFGTGYLTLEKVIRKYPDEAKAITAVKLFSIGVLCSMWAISEGHNLEEVQDVLTNPVASKILIYTGLVTTAGAILLQSVAFKRVSAADASIIIASEPVWAAMVAYFAMGETMNEMDMAGAALILCASVTKELDLDKIIGTGTSSSTSSSSTSGNSRKKGKDVNRGMRIE